jgi:hypothetical protein
VRIVGDDLHTQGNTLVADVSRWTGDQLASLMLAFVTE